ncbi:YaaA family protein [Spongisporangium articulatum]|uniref:YaaA family protein n=1 Tax=Spongisporangium articulatum TaxID=3362603 RepID=A0ABW8ALR6_9ACTN
MLILLPPSESKAAPARRGRPVDVDGLSFPDLAPLRRKVLAALVETSARPDAVDLLGVGASLAGEVARNTRLEQLPTSPAHAVYTGVLYDALGWATLSPPARRLGTRRVLIASALWGAVRPNDRIPPYRLSMDGDLPGLGALARLWRERLPQVLDDASRRGVVVDCRSGTYAAAAPLATFGARGVAIRVLREENGKRSVVSHLAKHTRGEVARFLLESGETPRRATDLADLLATRWPVELDANRLDVVLRD